MPKLSATLLVPSIVLLLAVLPSAASAANACKTAKNNTENLYNVCATLWPTLNLTAIDDNLPAFCNDSQICSLSLVESVLAADNTACAEKYGGNARRRILAELKARSQLTCSVSGSDDEFCFSHFAHIVRTFKLAAEAAASGSSASLPALAVALAGHCDSYCLSSEWPLATRMAKFAPELAELVGVSAAVCQTDTYGYPIIRLLKSLADINALSFNATILKTLCSPSSHATITMLRRYDIDLGFEWNLLCMNDAENRPCMLRALNASKVAGLGTACFADSTSTACKKAIKTVVKLVGCCAQTIAKLIKLKSSVIAKAIGDLLPLGCISARNTSLSLRYHFESSNLNWTTIQAVWNSTHSAQILNEIASISGVDPDEVDSVKLNVTGEFVGTINAVIIPKYDAYNASYVYSIYDAILSDRKRDVTLYSLDISTINDVNFLVSPLQSVSVSTVYTSVSDLGATTYPATSSDDEVDESSKAVSSSAKSSNDDGESGDKESDAVSSVTSLDSAEGGAPQLVLSLGLFALAFMAML